MAQTDSVRTFSAQELAAFRAFATQHLRKTQADFAEAQRERKLTLARAAVAEPAPSPQSSSRN